jgi:signal transduction histidine kinase
VESLRVCRAPRRGRGAHIFEPFYRVPGSRQPGTGLGLATWARIVDAHRGHVAVESKVGEGTKFTIFLPVTPSATPSV